jgi:hypothetical protein
VYIPMFVPKAMFADPSNLGILAEGRNGGATAPVSTESRCCALLASAGSPGHCCERPAQPRARLQRL